jgi:hypothetical protein
MFWSANVSKYTKTSETGRFSIWKEKLQANCGAGALGASVSFLAERIELRLLAFDLRLAEAAPVRPARKLFRSIALLCEYSGLSSGM